MSVAAGAAFAPPRRDQLAHEPIGLGLGADQRRPRQESSEPPGRELADGVGAIGRGQEQQRGAERRGAEVRPADERVAQWREVRIVGADAEHGAHDDVERDRLSRRVERERPADRPAVDLARGRVAHRFAVCAHAVAMKRRQHQPSLAQVTVAIEHEQRVFADDRAQDQICFAGVQRVGIAGPQVADRDRLGEHYDRGRDSRQPQREHVAVARRHVVEKRQRRAQPAHHVDDRSRRWACR